MLTSHNLANEHLESDAATSPLEQAKRRNHDHTKQELILQKPTVSSE
jgi:hypothetical protein